LVLRRARVDLHRPRATDAARFLAVGVVAAPLVVAASSAALIVDDSATTDTGAVARTLALVDMTVVAIVVPIAALVRGMYRHRSSAPPSVARGRRVRAAVQGVLALV